MDHRQVLQVFSDDPDFLEQVESALSLVSGFAAGRHAVSEFLASHGNSPWIYANMGREVESQIPGNL